MNRLPAPTYDFDSSLKNEAEHAGKTYMLLLSENLTDISHQKSERKSGTDFLLQLSHGAVRLENKFERHASGRVTLELLSVDRPTMAPGWMWSSRAAWLFSWFIPSAEMVAWPLDELRKVFFANPLRHKATTAYNQNKKFGGNPYMSWSALEDIHWLLPRVPGACHVDLHEELGSPRERPRMLARWAAFQVSAEGLRAKLRAGPLQGTPRQPPSPQEFREMLPRLWALNFRKTEPVHMRSYQELRQHIKAQEASALLAA